MKISRFDRRRFVASSVVSGAAILAVGQPSLAGSSLTQQAVLVAQDDSSDGSMFRGNAARTGVMPGPGPNPANGVEAIWTFGRSGPVTVIDGVAFMGSRDANLYAIDTETGVELWRFETGNEIYSSPAVAGGLVYFGSRDCNLYALDTGKGSERWRFTAGDAIFSSPAAVNGDTFFSSLDGFLYAVDAEDGTERWRFAVDGTSGSSPTVVDGVVYFGSGDHSLYAISIEDGEKLWQFEIDVAADDEIGTPAVEEGVAYITSGSHLYAVDVIAGTELWRLDASDSSGFSDPAVAGGVVYVGGPNSTLYAVSARDRAELWRFKSDGGRVKSPAVANDVVYFGSSDGTFYAVNGEDGKELWRFASGSENYLYSFPVIEDGLVFVGSGGTLYVIGARTPELSVGVTAWVAEKTSLRSGPAPTAVERAEMTKGTTVKITGESATTNDVVWWPVTVDETGAQGWVEASKLEPPTSGPEPTSAP